MESYVNAPATKMLASHCCVCALPLVDAESVEKGIGPICRKRYKYDIPADDAARKRANALVHEIALVQKGAKAFVACRELHDLGWFDLAGRIMHRLTKIEIEAVGEELVVRTPMSLGFNAGLKGAHLGATWSKDAKGWRLPGDAEVKVVLYRLLVKHFEGKWANGPKGPFVVGAKTETTTEAT